MMVIPESVVVTWRDLADRLTVRQFAQVESMERIDSPWTGDELARLLLGHTRECLKRNCGGH
jgi:hypothetical protein